MEPEEFEPSLGLHLDMPYLVWKNNIKIDSLFTTLLDELPHMDELRDLLCMEPVLPDNQLGMDWSLPRVSWL